VNGNGIRARIGFLSHNLALFPDLTATENLLFFARLYGIGDRLRRAAELLREVGLEAWGEEPVRGFSRGMKQRLALARVFLHEPDVLLLDEPFTGLDLASARSLATRLAAARAKGAAVVLTSHQLEIAAPLGDRAVFLRRGLVEERLDLAGLAGAERTARVEEVLRRDGT
jgi:heme exporter protein A